MCVNFRARPSLKPWILEKVYSQVAKTSFFDPSCDLRALNFFHRYNILFDHTIIVTYIYSITVFHPADRLMALFVGVDHFKKIIFFRLQSMARPLTGLDWGNFLSFIGLCILQVVHLLLEHCLPSSSFFVTACENPLYFGIITTN